MSEKSDELNDLAANNGMVPTPAASNTHGSDDTGHQATMDRLKSLSAQNLGPVELALILKDLSKESGVSVSALKQQLKIFGAEQSASEDETHGVLYTDKQTRVAEMWLSEVVLFPKFEKMINEGLGRVISPVGAKCLLLIIGLFLLHREQVIGFWGNSSEGKTSLAELLLKLVDVEGRLKRICRCYDMSKETLKYLGGPDGKGLVEKILFLDEMNPSNEGRDDRRQQLLRQAINDDCPEVTFAIVEPDKTGAQAVRTLRLAKPFYVVFTTITPPHRWDEQYRSRALFCEVRLTPEQVTKAKEQIADPLLDDEGKLYLLHSFNLFLQKLVRQNPEGPDAFGKVKIPYLKKLVKHNPSATGMELRRFKLIRSLIESSAILHQNHREIETDKRGRKLLIAIAEDYENVKDVVSLLLPPLNKPAGRSYTTTFRTSDSLCSPNLE